jgi:hypothetical protein
MRHCPARPAWGSTGAEVLHLAPHVTGRTFSAQTPLRMGTPSLPVVGNNRCRHGQHCNCRQHESIPHGAMLLPAMPPGQTGNKRRGEHPRGDDPGMFSRNGAGTKRRKGVKESASKRVLHAGYRVFRSRRHSRRSFGICAVQIRRSAEGHHHFPGAMAGRARSWKTRAPSTRNVTESAMWARRHWLARESFATSEALRLVTAPSRGYRAVGRGSRSDAS